MHCISIVAIIIAVTLLVQLSFALKLEDGKFYNIKNGVDKSPKGYLTAVNNGKNCKRRADVITTQYRSNGPTKKAQEWLYMKYGNGREYLKGEFENEVTFENKTPFCNERLQPYTLKNVSETEYTIMNSQTNKCLTAVGPRKRISWETCKRKSARAGKQRWKFIKVPMPFI